VFFRLGGVRVFFGNGFFRLRGFAREDAGDFVDESPKHSNFPLK